ncbi:hypothetical protein SUDANB43_03898 [Streptomyces sp. enrichment culture]
MWRAGPPGCGCLRRWRGCLRRWRGCLRRLCGFGGGAGCLRAVGVRGACGACAGSVGVRDACGAGAGSVGVRVAPWVRWVGRGRAGGCPSSERRGIGGPQICTALTRQPLRADTPRPAPSSPYAAAGRPTPVPGPRRTRLPAAVAAPAAGRRRDAAPAAGSRAAGAARVGGGGTAQAVQALGEAPRNAGPRHPPHARTHAGAPRNPGPRDPPRVRTCRVTGQPRAGGPTPPTPLPGDRATPGRVGRPASGARGAPTCGTRFVRTPVATPSASATARARR